MEEKKLVLNQKEKRLLLHYLLEDYAEAKRKEAENREKVVRLEKLIAILDKP
jgi:hypothetical protein